MRPLAIVGLLVFIAFVVLGQAVGGPPGRSKPLPLPPGELELRVFDVGQGDAILLRFGERALLVDAGPDPQTARQVLLPRLARLGVDRLDGLVLTHADADHIGGAADILGALPVTTLWMSEPEQDHPLLSVIEAAAARAGSRIERPRDGEALQWHPAVSIHVRFAAPDVAGSDNNQSMVVQVRYGDADFLLTGDIERAAERALVSANGGLEADVLKVAHHGASTSSSPEFLACREAAGGDHLRRAGERLQPPARRCAAPPARARCAGIPNRSGRRCGGAHRWPCDHGRAGTRIAQAAAMVVTPAATSSAPTIRSRRSGSPRNSTPRAAPITMLSSRAAETYGVGAMLSAISTIE